jgi:two-component system chemotaxis response regulator CheB
MSTPAPEHRLSVFVVEDSEVLRKRLDEWLTANPRVTMVGGAREASTAIAEIQRLSPDVVILDVALARNTSGFDVLRAIANGTHPHPTVLVFTNHGTAPYRDAALRLGAAQFYDKNNDFMRMMQEVARLAEFRGTRNGSEG